MATNKLGPFKADHVGSFLRPATLKQARQDFTEGIITKEALRTIEDAVIEDLVAKQKEIGLTAVTDGEFRRKFWHLDFIQELNGIQTYEEETPGMFQGSMSKITKYVVDGPLGFPKDHSFLEDFLFLRGVADDHVAKITIPGPNMIFHSGVIINENYDGSNTYESLEEVANAIVRVYQDAIQTFYDAGCRYLQLDDTSWGALFSETHREKIEQQGYHVDDVMELFAQITIDTLKNKPEDMAVTLHICRGNFKSAWLYEGDYEPIAKTLFSQVNVDAFFLEFDTDRSGDFAPLRFIKDQQVVLGLITTKTAKLEDKQEIKERIKEAEAYVDLSQLCLSPQCGFASTEEGNLITEEEQWDKLKLVKEIAEEVWQ